MNHYLKFAAAAVLLLAVSVLGTFAQVTGEPVIGSISCTNNVPNNSTTTAQLGDAIDVGRYSQICIQPGFKLTAAGTTACTFKFSLSADGTNYPTSAPILMPLVPAGTTLVYTNVNVDVGAAKYIKLAAITAADNTAAMTNIAVVYSVKGDRKDGGP